MARTVWVVAAVEKQHDDDAHQTIKPTIHIEPLPHVLLSYIVVDVEFRDLALNGERGPYYFGLGFSDGAAARWVF
ncbi:hypothetical protein BN1232_06420 [Mycobacterium lentiflavum]|uniref:Uncharacterized protein n=2 Tax=Mycobacterium simiae complex TaxID=2249310 RepID=A0A0E4H3M5_MYCLN|nr:hypothetical protein B5M45_27525 [Mycobacterium simiae]CQD24856.1 hypothetical protein BN1232_06420 [Mycobacterium lentiflavum]